MKKCSKCFKEKEIFEFQKNRVFSDGVNCWCKECCSSYLKKYRALNKDKIIEDRKKRYLDNKVEMDATCREYYRKNREKQRAIKAAYYLSNKLKWKEYREKNRAKFNSYPVERRKKDLMFAVAGRLRDRTRAAFKGRGWIKAGASEKLLGTSFKSAVSHIESKFLDGMSWENRSLWHIDHIIPLASAKTPEELAVLCKYTNLQPLWAVDNIIKGAKMSVS